MKTELELLPPNKKQECEECHKKYRRLTKCKDNKFRCGNCKRKMITNKFYIPFKKKGRGIIGRYSLTDREKHELHRQFMQGGLSSHDAWKKVNEHISMLRRVWFKNRWKKNLEPKKQPDFREEFKKLK